MKTVTWRFFWLEATTAEEPQQVVLCGKSRVSQTHLATSGRLTLRGVLDGITSRCISTAIIWRTTRYSLTVPTGLMPQTRVRPHLGISTGTQNGVLVVDIMNHRPIHLHILMDGWMKLRCRLVLEQQAGYQRSTRTKSQSVDTYQGVRKPPASLPSTPSQRPSMQQRQPGFGQQAPTTTTRERQSGTLPVLWNGVSPSSTIQR